MIIAFFLIECLDGLRLRNAVELLKKPKVLLHEQEPLWTNLIMFHNSWKPLPEVYKTCLRVPYKLVFRCWLSYEGQSIILDIYFLQRFRRGDDINVVICSVEKPFEISHVQINSIRELTDHGNRSNMHNLSISH